MLDRQPNGTGETVVLACYDTVPDAAALRELSDYAKKVRRHQNLGGQGASFILALKEGDIDEEGKLQGQPLRTVSESKLLDNLVNFDDYYRELRRRVEQDPLPGTDDVTLSQVYTVSRYKLEKHGEPIPDLEGFLNDWLNETSCRQMALLGEYGQGKSTASTMLSYHLMQRQRNNSRATRIPILLELRGKSPRTLREDELLSTWAGRYGIDTRALLKLLVAGRLLLIFEGFDAVDLSGDADARVEHFKILWSLCYPKAKILMTGRPNYFLDDAELKAALGIQEASLERPFCQVVYIAPFGAEEMESAMRNVKANTRRGILELADKNDRFRDIVSRPSMLHVVSILWEKENLAQFGGRINSAVVMDLFIRHSLERQEGKGKKPNYMALTGPERAYFMEGIAVHMLVNDLPNQISGKDLEKVMRLLIDAMPDVVSTQTDALGGGTRKPLRQRFDFKSKPDDWHSVLTDVRSCGLLVSDLSRSGSFKFGHKSFMEFMSAKTFSQWSFKDYLKKAEKQKNDSLVNRLGLKFPHVVAREDCLLFAIEWTAWYQRESGVAANLLFQLIFKDCNLTARYVGLLSKVGVRALGSVRSKKDAMVASWFVNTGISLVVLVNFIELAMDRGLANFLFLSVTLFTVAVKISFRALVMDHGCRSNYQPVAAMISIMLFCLVSLPATMASALGWTTQIKIALPFLYL